MIPRSLIGALAAFGALAATPVVAQEFCVACTGPDAVYRCVIADPRPGTGGSFQAACLTALAADGKHKECSVRRGVTVFQCDAPIKRITLGQLGAPGTPASSPQVVQPVPPPAPDPNAPPRTLLEAAQRAKQATDQQLGKTQEKMQDAGQATSTFFEKSLRCIGSLFTKCSDAP